MVGSISSHVAALIPNLVNYRIFCLQISLKPRDPPFRGVARASFPEQRLVIEPTRGPAVVFSLRVVCSCGRAMPLSAIATMTPLPSEDKTTGIKGQIKGWVESYRQVRQRTVRSETTKAVYAVHRNDNESQERLRFPEENECSTTTRC